MLLLLGSIIFSACKRKPATADFDYMGKKLAIEEVDFDFFSARSKIRYEDPKTTLNATANIRMRKDSVIWMSISPALGIEAARGLITRDSVVFMNRLNREYTVFTYEALSKRFNFDIDYKLIQSVLLGNMPLERAARDKVSMENDVFIVNQQAGNIDIANYIGANSMKIERVHMTEKKNSLNMNYGDFRTLDAQAFPYSNEITLQYTDKGKPTTTSIKIDYSRAETGDTSLSFPFDISSRYTKKTL